MNKLLSLLNILEDILLVIYNFFFRYSQIWWKKKIGWHLNSTVVACTKWVKKQLWHFNINSFDGDLVLRLFPLCFFQDFEIESSRSILFSGDGVALEKSLQDVYHLIFSYYIYILSFSQCVFNLHCLTRLWNSLSHLLQLIVWAPRWD